MKNVLLGNKEKWISVGLNLVKNDIIYCSLYCCKMHSWKTSNIFIYKYICCKIKIHCVTACRPTVLMRILCAEWCTWTTLSHSTQAHSAYAHPVRRMMHLKLGLWRWPWQPRLCIATGGCARDVTHSITSIIQSFVNKCNNSNSCKLFYLD